MNKDFDYSLVPETFAHCVQSSCIRANDCLRYKVMQHATPARDLIWMVNPAWISGDGSACSYFLADKKTRFALGITHLLDNVPYKKAVEIKRELKLYLGRNTYYRVRSKERLLQPAEQNYIRQLFLRKEMIGEPLFDSYVELYDWQPSQ